MAATESFHAYVGSLGQEEKKLLDIQIRNRNEDLQSAKSEDARLRILAEFLADAKKALRTPR